MSAMSWSRIAHSTHTSSLGTCCWAYTGLMGLTADEGVIYVGCCAYARGFEDTWMALYDGPADMGTMGWTALLGPATATMPAAGKEGCRGLIGDALTGFSRY